MRSHPLLLSCEHARGFVPPAYRQLFESTLARRHLVGHRGYDIGALALAEALRSRFGCPLVAGAVSRLLVDLNRSPHHPRLFSEYTRGLDATRRMRLLDQYYVPHRNQVSERVAQLVQRRGWAVHVAVHSFTPRLHGVSRRADVGLLYDPGREQELALARAWQDQLRLSAPWLKVRRNYPYRGISDGLTRALREKYTATRYLGLELEVNQRLLRGRRCRDLDVALSSALVQALDVSRRST